MMAFRIALVIAANLICFGTALAQFKDLPNSLGRLDVDGINVSLWISQEGKNIYFVPYVSADWSHFETSATNSINLNGSVKQYCNKSSMDQKLQEWEIKLDFWHKELPGRIVETWNNSNRPKDFSSELTQGFIDNASLSLPPMKGYLVEVELSDNDSIILVSSKSDALGETLAGSKYEILKFTGAQLCEWYKRRRAEVLSGYIIIEGMTYDNTIARRDTVVESVRRLESKIELAGKKIAVSPNVSLEEVEALEASALTAISAATGLATSAGTLTGPGVVVPPLAGGAAAVAVKVKSARLKSKIREFEEAEAFVTSFTDDTIEKLSNEVSDELRVYYSSDDQKLSDWLESSSDLVKELLTENTFNFSLETTEGVATFRDSSGEIALEIQKSGIPAGIKGPVTFQLFSSKELSTRLSQRAAFFNQTGVQERKIALTRVVEVEREISTFFEERFRGELDLVQADAIRVVSDTQGKIGSELDAAELRSETLLSDLDASFAAYDASIRGIDRAAAAVDPTTYDLPCRSLIWWYPPNKGTIVPPTGWDIADGRKVRLACTGEEITTPNLIGKGVIGARANVAGDLVGEDEITISGKTDGTALSWDQMPSHSHGMVYNKKHNPGLFDMGGNTLEMRLRSDTDEKNKTTLTKSSGKSEKHDHPVNLTFDNRSASILLVPLIKL